MEVFCSLRSLVGSVCGFDKKDRNRDTQIVSLASCKKDIGKHLSGLGFGGVENEIDLILCRAGIFSCDADRLSSMTICPHHRAVLGLGWTRGSSTRCKVPQTISQHGKGKGSWPKGDRGIGKQEAISILNKTGILIQVGSGVCRRCRETLMLVEQLPQSEEKSEVSIASEPTLTDKLHELSILDNDELCTNTDSPWPQTPETTPTVSCTPFSLYKPSSEKSQPPVTLTSPKDKLNSFLSTRDISPIRRMNLSWEDASERTKRLYTRKARQVVNAVLDEISPDNSDMLLQAVKTSNVSDIDSTLMQALAECYNNATHWSTRRQILSIMADKVGFKELQMWIPQITRYRFNIARQHILLHGRGSVIEPTKNTKICVSPQKLDHFLTFITSTSVIQDLPFGEKSLTLSSNTKITVPNVIRTLIPEQIVQQYQSYCEESDFTPLSRSTLCRILKVCSASVRKSLQGLDYISAEGSKSFDDLEDIVAKLGDEHGMGHTWAKDQSNKLKLAKRYLKGDYKVHVAESSRVADHCRAHALSHKTRKDTDHYVKCDHEHDLQCDRCKLIPSVFDTIDTAFQTTSIPNEEKEEMTYLVTQSKKCIEAWKAHLLRSVNQDEARLDTIKNLDPKSVLIVLDWAMKFLPKKYRESQSDWFGKRGISWHIAVVTRKLDSTTETLTFVHIFRKCSQDSPTVVAIVEDVVRQLKLIMPAVQNVYLRQDNAGCYHSAPTTLALQQIATKYNVKMRLDFSDPQGGKGSCDRKAASLKNKIKMYLNSGHDVNSADQLKAAIESLGGVPGVSVTLCDLPTIPDVEAPKWDGISFINNFEYHKDGIRTWREYGIGPGKFLQWSSFSIADKYPIPQLNIASETAFPTNAFVALKTRSKPAEPSGADDTGVTGSEHTDEESGSTTVSKLFSCPNEGCVKSYQRFSSLQHHLDIGKHIYALERETLFDKAMLSYAKKLEEGTSSIQNPPEAHHGVSQTLDFHEPLEMGWALKSTSPRKRLTPIQKEYLTRHFDIGEQTGHKVDPANVSASMRKARNADGTRLFETSDFLTPRQISSFFSRLAKKRRQVDRSDTEDDDDEEEFTEQLQEEQFYELTDEIMKEISISHPILFEAHNICELTAKSRLNKFSVQMLQEICDYFELELTPSMKKNKRVTKKPYIDLISELVANCTCSSSSQD